MTAIRLTILLACITLLAGCVGSVHPLYVEGETVFREELLGEYEMQIGMGAPTAWTVESIDDEAYRVTMQEGPVDPKIWIMHVVELDDQLYIDLFPEADDADAEANAESPRHVIARLRFEEDTPVTTEISRPWLEDYIAEHPDELAIELRERKMPLITSSTEDLQRFIIAHADEGLFDDSVDGREVFKGEFSWPRREP